MASDHLRRRDAKAAGLTHYFTGMPCKNGHIDRRLVGNKHCLSCHREARAIIRREAPAVVKATKAASYLRHRDEVIAKVTAYQASRPEWNRARRARYRAKRRLKLSV